MSTKAIDWAICYPAERVSEKALLLILASYSNKYGVSWPSQRTLALRSSLAERSVRRILVQMERKGVIRRVERRRPGGSRQSDLILLEAFTDRQPAPPGMLGSEGETRGEQPAKLAGCGGGNRQTDTVYPVSESALDTSMIRKKTLSSSRPRSSRGPDVGKAGGAFVHSALAEAALEYASKLGVPFEDAPSPIDPMAPKPSRIEPLPAISAHLGWKLIRQTGFQNMVRAAGDPDARAALCDAADALEAALAPASSEQAAHILWELGCAMLPRKQSRPAELAAGRQWLADLADYPADIIDAACAEWRRGPNRFFPRPGELLALARPILEARQLWAKRARSLADARQPTESKCL